MTGGQYDDALICASGHVINSAARARPVHNAPFCPRCGMRAIEKCLKCDTKVRGGYSHAGLAGYRVPAFCHACATAFPWTENRLQAARDLVLEAAKLTEEERQELGRSLDDLVKDTPRTPVAVLRFKTLALKAGGFIASGLREVLSDAVSDEVRRMIWPSA
jgi:hypothetical protein